VVDALLKARLLLAERRGEKHALMYLPQVQQRGQPARWVNLQQIAILLTSQALALA